MPDSNAVPSLSDVFDVLQESARSAAASGRVLYGPQAKKALQTRYPGLDLRALGYKKLIDLLRAGHDAGRFELVTVDGHPHVIPALAAPRKRPVEQGRLRADLWTSLVTWDHGERYWDRRNRRAVFVPTTEDGTPEWQVFPNKYVKIDAVPMQTQLEWMVDFANDQTERVQVRLLEALKNPTPGAFKVSLNDLGLAAAWRTRLRQRVTEHASEWAARAHLSPASILDPASRSSPKSASRQEPEEGEAFESPSTTDEAARLRARVHQIVDRMTLSELAQLQVPAAYLLER
ncbi:OST-HTH/LOTUS domain-containing protein [Curtobacterium sp. ME26]|uniref:OST-HTH/LOTUS domain-containing protein n=1 Tax=Curtobacterium sp. ME26 TaxID=2744254 RepID=UPI0015F756D3|nr:OST-HTH/LOTUS domain-containing protein [Curtobacterium sp. ME26]